MNYNRKNIIEINRKTNSALLNQNIHSQNVHVEKK